MATRSLVITIAAGVAVVFGLATIVSGGRALFTSADMGAVVPFVLGFNFLAGFGYVAAGIGLWREAPWARPLAVAIFAATALVFGAFLVHISTGGAYETRTLGAMVLRVSVWGVIAALATRVARRPA